MVGCLTFFSEIVLSFAPSAAAAWHCDHVSITCERNSVRHSVFFKRWAGQFVIIIHEVEFKADATAATHEQMQQIILKSLLNKDANTKPPKIGRSF